MATYIKESLTENDWLALDCTIVICNTLRDAVLLLERFCKIAVDMKQEPLRVDKRKNRLEVLVGDTHYHFVPQGRLYEATKGRFGCKYVNGYRLGLLMDQYELGREAIKNDQT